MIVIGKSRRRLDWPAAVDHKTILRSLDSTRCQLVELIRDGLQTVGFLDPQFTRTGDDSIPLSQLNAESIEISLHYNKLSLRDPVLENVIRIIRQAF